MESDASSIKLCEKNFTMMINCLMNLHPPTNESERDSL